jgi:Ca2+/H+ antiporter, TMEM165/GDT1 family
MYSHVVAFISAFLGSAVESVEALTIVLAVGLTRGWRAPLQGTLAALVCLVIIVVLFGALITSRVPESALRLVVGSLILLFGLRWLQKAVLRSAGVIALHDEEAAFKATVAEIEADPRRDWVGFVVAFKGVLLEGLEVAFIVFAVGSNDNDLTVAALGGVAAILVVAGLGLVVRQPLSRVPENGLKFAVGLALSSLGTFWAAEGMGVSWPLDIGAVLGLAAIYLGGALFSVQLIRSRQRPRALA